MDPMITKVGEPGAIATLEVPGKAIGATSIKISSDAKFPKNSFFVFKIGVKAGSEIDQTTVTTWLGKITASNTISQMTLLSGDDREYAANAETVIYIAISSVWANMLTEALLKTLNPDGTLKDDMIGSSKLTAKSVTGDKIKDGTVEPKHIKPNSFKLEWKEVAYANGFAAYTGGSFQRPQYAKDAFDVVHLRGLIAHAQPKVTEKAMFILPEGFRPKKAEIFATPNAATIGRVNVLSNGEVHLSEAYLPNSTLVALSGISFSVD